MTRVLIAVDDSETSVAAAQAAHRLFGPDAEYTVVNVADTGPVIWGDDALQNGTVYPLALPGAGVVGGLPFVVRTPGSKREATDDRVDVAEQTAGNVAREAGLSDAQPVGEGGSDPAADIVAAAREHQADVIVVGSHERGWFKRLFGSSVADAVVRDSDVPVLVAR